jgi:hypothetical protein
LDDPREQEEMVREERPRAPEAPAWRMLAAAGLMAGAGGYLIFGDDKGMGIFAVLVAAVIARLLVLSTWRSGGGRR